MNALEKTKYFAQKSSSGIYLIHLEQVRAYATQLAGFLNADIEVVQIASLLHDINQPAHPDVHTSISVDVAREFLQAINYSAQKCDLVLSAIAFCNPDLARIQKDPSLESRIVADADKMSSISPVGLMRTIMIRSRLDNLDYGSIRNRLEKKLKLYGELSFDESRSLIEKEYLCCAEFLSLLPKGDLK